MIKYEFIGVDIAKNKFDACLLKEKHYTYRTFDNTAGGLHLFLNWIKSHCQQAWICMEATGHYSEQLADFLINEGLQVSIINPMQIKYFSRVQLSRNKNDRVDGKIIADYCQHMQPKLYLSRTSEQKYLRELLQLEETLKMQKTQLKNQSNTIQSPAIKDKFKELIKAIDDKIKQLQEDMGLHIEKNEQLQQSVNLITSIKGFGKLSASRFLAYLPDICLFNTAKQLAAFIGISPKQKESGQYKGKTKLSKFGNPRLRNTLYMPALCAKRYNADLQPFVSRLKTNGLAPKAIVGALMRKLVHIIFGMLKNNSSFNPELV